MSLSKEQAAETLRDIQTAERRSHHAYGYRMASPHLILWGAIWIVGYGVPWLFPGRVDWLWLPLVAGGTVASIAIGFAMRPKGGERSDLRFPLSFAILFAFVWAQLATMPHFDDRQAIVYIPILVALMYALMGIWTRGLRMALLGVGIGAIALIAYFYLPQFLSPIMAIAGGGGLLLGGLWLRSV